MKLSDLLGCGRSAQLPLQTDSDIGISPSNAKSTPRFRPLNCMRKSKVNMAHVLEQIKSINHEKQNEIAEDSEFNIRRQLSDRLDALVYEVVQGFKQKGVSKADVLSTLDLLWYSGARAYQKQDGMSLKSWMFKSGFKIQDINHVMQILRKTRNPTAPHGATKPLMFHGTPKYIGTLKREDGKTDFLGLGLIENVEGGYHSKTGKVFLATPDDIVSNGSFGNSQKVGRVFQQAKSYADAKGPRAEKTNIKLMKQLEKLNASLSNVEKTASATTLSSTRRSEIHLNYKLSDSEVDQLKKESIRTTTESIHATEPSNLTQAQKDFVLEGLYRFWQEQSRTTDELEIPNGLAVRCRNYTNGDTSEFANFYISEDKLRSLINKEDIGSCLTRIYQEDVGLTGILGEKVVPVVFGFEHHVETDKTHQIPTIEFTKQLNYRDEALPFEGNLKSIYFESAADWATYKLASRLKGDAFPSAQLIGLKEHSNHSRQYYDHNELSTVNDSFDAFIIAWAKRNQGALAKSNGINFLHGQFNALNANMLSIARTLNSELRDIAQTLLPASARNIDMRDRLSPDAKQKLPAITPSLNQA